MAKFKGHPSDGRRRHDYTERKIAHLRRVGLITGQSLGYGINGGACPDWLETERKEARKAADRKRHLSFLRAAGRFDGEAA